MPPSGTMSLGEARVADAVLTSAARGFKSKADSWPHLFPVVEVPARAGKIIKFEPYGMSKMNLIRAPGASRARVEHRYSSENYNCVQRALDGTVPREVVEEAAAVPGIDMQMVEVQATMKDITMAIELEAASIATTSANYDADHHTALAGANQWSHADSKPNKKVEEAAQKIMEGIGERPNVMIMGGEVFSILRNHKDVLDRVRYTEALGEDGQPTINTARLASYFDVPNVVVASAMTGEEGEFEYAWGKNVVLAYSNVSGLASMGSPSFGYTYRRRGYPLVEPGWFDKDTDSYRYPVTTEDTPVIVGKAGGYLLSNVIA